MNEQQSAIGSSWSVLGRSLSTLIIALFYLFVLCDTGEELTNRFQSIGDSIYNCSWNTFPNEFQKCVPTMLAVAQKPIYLQGMGRFCCTRRTFKLVRVSIIPK